MSDLGFPLAMILCWALFSPTGFGEWLGKIAKAFNHSKVQEEK